VCLCQKAPSFKQTKATPVLSKSLSTSQIIAKIKDLPLVAKCIAQGFLHGLQQSQQRGVGIEFNQYRPYEVGDELSRVDWKLYARSDRYFVREAEKESDIDIWFMLDTSRSMLEKNNMSKQGLNKLDYAKVLIASMAYLANKQGDQFGFIGISSNQLQFIDKGNGHKHWQQLMIKLTNTEAGQYFPPIEFLTGYLAKLQRSSIIFIVSDFYQKNNEIIDFLSKIDRRHSEIVAINLTSNCEINFDYGATDSVKFNLTNSDLLVRFKDLESNEEQLVSIKSARDDYLTNFRRYQSELNQNLNQLGIDMTTFDIEQPIESVLYQYLKSRARSISTIKPNSVKRD